MCCASYAWTPQGPRQDDYIQRVFAVMRECPQHQFQVLTKRAERLVELAPELEDLLELTRAGEPGVALEIFCTQVTDLETPIPRPIWARIQRLSREMGLDDDYWDSLSPLVRD